jgi:hypothetical protein
MPTFALVKFSKNEYPNWWELEGDTLYNMAGGHCTVTKNVEIIETVEVEDFDDLDYSKTALCSAPDDSMDGWLEPNGKYYPVNYGGHDGFAEMILKKSVRELEEGGWVRCHNKNIHSKKPYFIFKLGWENGRLTAEQRNALSKRGFNVEDWD